MKKMIFFASWKHIETRLKPCDRAI